MGEFTKIQEEFDELTDAHEQTNSILILCECVDLIGAIEEYTKSKYNINLNDLLKMLDKTKQAFNDGSRK